MDAQSESEYSKSGYYPDSSSSSSQTQRELGCNCPERRKKRVVRRRRTKRSPRHPLKYDPTFEGPRRKRSCTDVLFLLIFIVFLGVWGAIAFYGWTKGDPSSLFMATDSQGRRCGRDSEVLDKPYLFFFDLTKCANPKTLLNGCDTTQVCVAKCPTESWFSLPYRQGVKSFNESEVQNKSICIDENTRRSIKSAAILEKVVSEETCADWYVASQPVYDRCIALLGNSTDLNWKSVKDGLSTFSFVLRGWVKNYPEGDRIHEFTVRIVDDFMKSWRSIVVALVIAILFSLFYISLLRWIAGIMTWLSLLGVIALALTAAVFSFKRYAYLRDYGPDEVSSSMIQGQLEEFANYPGLWLAITIILGVLSLIALLVIIFLRKRIQIAITLIEEGSKAVSNVIASLFFPLIPWTLHVGVIAWAIFVWFILSSVGQQVFRARGMEDGTCVCSGSYKSLQNGNSCEPQLFDQLCSNSTTGASCTTAGCHFFRKQAPSEVIYFQIVNIFGLFWGYWFICGLSEMILAGTFAKWYWTFNKRNVPFFAVTSSAGRTLRYNMGTVAFGSLIIAICSFIRATIEYVQKKVKKYDNSFTRAIFCCLRCFFWCLEKFLRFVSKNAYIMCAVHGKNFCVSARDAFNLLMRNAIRVFVLDKVTDFIFFMGKLVITGCMITGSYYLFFRTNRLQLYYEATVPLVVVGVGSYVIAAIFFGVYSMAVDTLFLCFLEDCERNDGSVEKPYFMSKNLMRILGKRNKKPKKSS